MYGFDFMYFFLSANFGFSYNYLNYFQVILLATGFKVQEYFAPMKIIARNGFDVLADWTATNPKHYLGIMTAQVPNSFSILGPGSVSFVFAACFFHPPF